MRSACAPSTTITGEHRAANSPISYKLPVDAVYREINLSLEVANSTGVGGALTLNAPVWDRIPWTAIKRIELIADGKDTIKSYDGGTLFDLNEIDFGVYQDTQIASIGASLTNGTPTYPLWHALTISMESRGMVPEVDPKTGKVVGGPSSTLLDARKFSSLELRITFGAGQADIYNVVTAPSTLDRYFVTPWGLEVIDLDPSSSFAVNQEYMTSTAFPTTTATGRKFDLNVGNAYRALLLSSVDSNARAAVDRLAKFDLKENGVFSRRVVDAGFLKMLNFRESLSPEGYGLGAGAPTGIPTISTTQGKNSAGRLGVYYLNIAEDGRVGSLLDTRSYSSLALFVDYDGANTTDLFRICSRQILPNIG